MEVSFRVSISAIMFQVEPFNVLLNVTRNKLDNTTFNLSVNAWNFKASRLQPDLISEILSLIQSYTL